MLVASDFALHDVEQRETFFSRNIYIYLQTARAGDVDVITNKKCSKIISSVKRKINHEMQVEIGHTCLLLLM